MGVVVGLPLPEVAHHEAGHAVMALRFRWPVYEIVVREQQRLFRPPVARGYVKYANGNFDRSAAEYAAVCLAGPIAQAVHRHRVYGEPLKAARRRTIASNDGPPGTDLAKFDLAQKVAAADPDAPWVRDFGQAVGYVQRMVTEDWPRIARLAETAMRRHRLGRREIRRAVGR